MAGKLCPKLILEGTRLTLKTEIAFALNEHPGFVGPRRYRYHSPVISAEWCGFTPTPWGRGLINFEPGERERALETYSTWARLFELLPHYSWIVDRFHLSTRVFQIRRHDEDVPFDWLERRLAPLGFHMALCTRSPESFAAARTRRLEISGNPRQYDDLGLFIEEQDLYRRLARGSMLATREFDVSHDDPARTADEIVDWMRSTRGLWSVGSAAADDRQASVKAETGVESEGRE
jgi:hypothetical protein